MNKMKVFIQCGEEDSCSKKDCMNCPRKKRYNLNLTLAEEVAIEDFAVTDLDAMINGGEYAKGLRFPDKKKELELMQDVMRKLMHKIFKNQKKSDEEKKIIRMLRVHKTK